MAILSERSLSVYAQAQQTPQPNVKTVTHTLEVPSRNSIRGDEAHRFCIKLDVGQFFLVRVDQNEIDIKLALLGKNSEPIITMDDNIIGTEFLPVLADENRDYTFEVSAVSPVGTSKEYEITLSRPRLPKQIESRWAAIEKDTAEAATLVRQKKSDPALRILRTAAVSFRAINKLSREASTLYAIADIYYQTDRKPIAIVYYEKALKVSRQIRRSDMEAASLGQAAFLYSALGKKRKALEYNQLALPIFRDVVKDRLNEAATLNNLGLIFDDIGEKQKALDSYEKSLAVLLAEFGDSPEVSIQMGLLNNNMGRIFVDFGDHDKALKLLDQALEKAKDDPYTESLALNNIGQVYLTLGNAKAALGFFEKALTAGQKVEHERREEILSLNNVGHAKNRLQDFDGAIQAYKDAEKLSVKSRDPEGRAVATYSLGNVYHEKANRQSALKQFAIALRLAKSVGDREGQGVILNSIGDAHFENGNIGAALVEYSRAFRASQPKGLEAGKYYALYGMSKVAHKRSQFLKSRQLIQTVVEGVEKERERAHAKDLRASFLASKRIYYDFYVDLLMDMHRWKPAVRYDIAAFEISERMRARTLLELLSEANADIPRDVSADLVQKRRDLSRRLSDKSNALLRLPTTNNEEINTVKKEIDGLTIQLQRLEADIFEQSPGYANLAKPTPLSLREVQQRVVDSDSVLLHYTMTEKKVYLWSITPDRIKSYRLPSKTTIESAVLDFRTLVTTDVQWSAEVGPIKAGSCSESYSTETRPTVE